MTDVIVVGAGVAGLSVALGVHPTRSVLVIDAGDGSTAWAQGGIAAATEAADDPAAHAVDTATAGGGLCADDAVETLTREGPLAVADLLARGAQLDRTADGRLARTREGGHHRNRVVHAGGDATGAEVARTLRAAAIASGIELRPARVTGLTTSAAGQVTGVLLSTGEHLAAGAVVLATGGAGRAYPVSTNPPGVDSTGIALALLAGASVTDVEFVQFHPTALVTGDVHGQLPLVTEAIRGEGAVLRDSNGTAFMAGKHPLADLAPRDVVAREIDAVLRAEGADHVSLDATGIDAGTFARRFPTVLASCRRIGIDPTQVPIPVAPAAHFLCGGIRTDGWGTTDVPGLYAVGEAAATGVHGANRLASNSLLEGLVFGRRVAARLVLDPPAPDVRERAVELGTDPDPDAIRAVLGEFAGVRRHGAGLARAREQLDSLGRGPLATVAAAIVTAAQLRTESRGCHWRGDFPQTSPAWAHRIAVRLDPDRRPVTDIEAARSAA